MTNLLDELALLFTSKGWRVQLKSDDPLLSRFQIVAENNVAIVLGVEVDAGELKAVSAARAGTIAALMSPRSGPKVWEAYLLLATRNLESVPDDDLMEVKRDLNYCRRLVVDVDAVEASNDSGQELERQLLALFPFAATDLGSGPSVETMLEKHLVDSGNDPEIVEDLVHGLVLPQFDPLARLMGAPHAAEQD